MATAMAASSLFAAEPIDNSVRKYEIAVNDFTALKVVEGVTVRISGKRRLSRICQVYHNSRDGLPADVLQQ